MRENLPPFLRKTDRRKWGIWGIPREFPGNSRFSGVDRGTGIMTKKLWDRIRTVPREFGEFPGNSRGIPGEFTLWWF